MYLLELSTLHSCQDSLLKVWHITSSPQKGSCNVRSGHVMRLTSRSFIFGPIGPTQKSMHSIQF